MESASDDVLLCIFTKIGPDSALRLCSSRLLHLGNDELVWRTYAQMAGVDVDQQSNKPSSWRAVYKLARTCSQAWLIRDYRSGDDSKPVHRLWLTNPKHPAEGPACQHGHSTFASKCKSSLIVKPCFSPPKLGLRLQDMEFCCMRGDKRRWTETWYMMGERVYSIHGGLGDRLDTAVTTVSHEYGFF